MPSASDGPTIDQTPTDAPATVTAAGTSTPRDAPADFAPPGYEVLGELGRGGMGVVYRARHVALDRPVALKVILGAAHAGPDQLTRFRAEATAAARLSHPNIVQVYEVGEHAGQPYFSLELVEGGTLADRLRGEPQPPPAAAELVRTLARAVEHAHSRGIVHRDLKPANVLISPQSAVPSPQSGDPGLGTGDGGLGTVKVTDFGLAKRASAESHLTQTGAILGTPSYMAPEQAAGDGAAVGPPTDVYALGAILYECLTGRPPFKAATVMDTVLQVLHDDPVPPSRLQPKLPRDLETVCLKCLAKRPEQRYPSAAELADDLDRFVAGESVRARPTSAVVKGWKWARRHPARAVVLFVLAVPLPALLGVMVYLWDDARRAKHTAEVDRAAAVVAHQEADRERELAQGYLKNALRAMDQIVERVGDERLARIPAVQEERAAVLATALAFYETLLRLDSTDPMVRHETAQTYARVARISLFSGRTDQSANAAGSGVALFEALATESPDRPEYRNELAEAYMLLGHSRVLNADFAGGLEAYRKGAEVAGALAAEFPVEATYKATAAECHRSLGYYFTVARADEGEAHFKEALRLAEGLHRDRPTPAEYRALLASVLGAYAQFLVTHQRTAEAGPLVDRGLALVDKAAGRPMTGRTRLNHDQAAITLRVSAATIHERAGRRERSRELLTQATAGYEELIAGQPQSFPYRLQAVTAYLSLGRVLRAELKVAEAVKATGRAVELYDEMLREFPVFKEAARSAWFLQQRQGAVIQHALNLIAAGRPADATGLATAAETGPPVPTGVQAYNLACVYALLAGTAEGSARESHVAQAMTWLKRAARSGYPATATAIEHVRTRDDDLNALRDRPEFREWLAALKPAKGK